MPSHRDVNRGGSAPTDTDTIEQVETMLEANPTQNRLKGRPGYAYLLTLPCVIGHGPFVIYGNFMHRIKSRLIPQYTHISERGVLPNLSGAARHRS